MRFKDKVVVIAGAAGNLGQSTTEVFFQEGANLALIDRSMDRLERFFPNAAGSSRHLFVECVDMSDSEKVQGAADTILTHFGHIDVFVTLVGGYRAGSPLQKTSLATFDYLMNLNARTFFVGAQIILPAMLARGYGKIIGIGARPGLKGAPDAAAYSAAKGALLRLVESLAEEVRDQGINVNCVLPGLMDTPQNRSASPDADYSQWVSTDSVAEVIAFLASQEARDIHGALVPVYGRT